MRFLLIHFRGTCAEILELWVIRINNGRSRKNKFCLREMWLDPPLPGNPPPVLWLEDLSEMTHSRGFFSRPSRTLSFPPVVLIPRRGGEARILYSVRVGIWIVLPRPVSGTKRYEAVHLLPGLHLVMTVNHDSWKSSGPSYHLGVLPSDISSCDKEAMETKRRGQILQHSTKWSYFTQ